MNETKKTGIFAAIAAVMILLAVVTRPHTVTKQDEQGGLAAGELLFKEEASDISKAAALKITKFDENKLSMDSFEIVKDKSNGLWKIPSEYDYPADAEEQLKNATTPLSDLRILNIINDAGRDDHALYGVIEPNDKLEAGVTGVGMLVSVADAAGKTMASLIVGKQVDKAQEKLHFVRIPNQDPVYTVELDPVAFDTNFKKWIKPDLLQVKSFDITGVGIRDYQIERQQQGGRLNALMSKSMEADMTYDTGTSKWKLDKLVTFEEGKPVPVELGESDELKSDKLNSLRTAAQSLQIVGVRPKPKGLASDLKADKTLLDSDESMISLFEQGFIPQSNGDSTEIFAVAGETLLTTQDGVRYDLRFGEERVASAVAESTEGESKTGQSEAGRERYLLVTASLDESRFPPPDLQAVPETVEDLKKLDAEKAAAEAAKNAPPQPASEAGQSPATETKPDAANTDATPPSSEDAKPEPPKADEPTTEADSAAAPKRDEGAENNSCVDSQVDAQDAAGEDAAGEDAAVQDAAAQGTPAQDVKSTDQATATSDDKSTAASAATQTTPPAADKPAETEEELKDRLSVVQGDITKSNQRLIDARNEKMNAARKKVQELNARFADWYYLIEESSFKQLMLKRDVLVGSKAAKNDAPASPGGFPGLPSSPNLPLGPQ